MLTVEDAGKQIVDLAKQADAAALLKRLRASEPLVAMLRRAVSEYLKLASSAEEQLEYARQVDWIDVGTEILCQWEDLAACGDGVDPEDAGFDSAEARAIREFHQAWERVCDAGGEPLPPVNELLRQDPWREFMNAAATAQRAIGDSASVS